MKIGIVVPAIITTVMVVSVQAAEYTARPYATARVDADTNKRLTNQDADTTTGTGLSGGVALTAATERSSYTLTPRFNIAQYSDDGNDVDQDTDDYFIDWNSSHLLSERFSAGTTFTYANSGVVGTELDELGLVLNGDDNFSQEVGQIQDNFSRETISGGGSVTYIYDERNSFSIGGNYSETEYDTNRTGLSNYDNQSLNATWSHQISETDQVSVSVYASTQDSEQSFLLEQSINNGLTTGAIDTGSDENGISLGYIRSFSDTLVGRFNIGMRNTDTEYADLVDFDYQLSPASATALSTAVTNNIIQPVLDSNNMPVTNLIERDNPALSDPTVLTAVPTLLQDSNIANRAYIQGENDGSGLTLDMSVEKLYDDKTTLTAGVSKGTQTTGQGRSDNEEIYFRGIYLWSDRLTANGSLRFLTIESENESTLFPDAGKSDQIRLELGLDWRWTEFWSVGAGYSYREIDRDDGGSADGHGVFFTLGYNGNVNSISR